MSDISQGFSLNGSQPVQGGIFGGMSFQPLGWDAPTGSTPAATGGGLSLPDVPALPSIGGSAGSAASGTIQQAATAAGITGGAVPPAATTGSTTASTGASVANSWFIRGTIVILGFVFVAVGLSQFGVVQKLRP